MSDHYYTPTLSRRVEAKQQISGSSRRHHRSGSRRFPGLRRAGHRRLASSSSSSRLPSSAEAAGTTPFAPPPWVLEEDQATKSDYLEEPSRSGGVLSLSHAATAPCDAAESMSPAAERPQRTRFLHTCKSKLKAVSCCWTVPGCNCAAPCLPLSYSLSGNELQEYAYIYQKAIRPADPHLPYHERLIADYWRALYPRIPQPAIPSWHWQLAGFQSCSPWTDFRGGGALALELICAFARAHTQALRSMVDDCLPQLTRADLQAATPPTTLLTQSTFYYPFSASFINVEFALVHFLRLNSDLAKVLESRLDSPESNRSPKRHKPRREDGGGEPLLPKQPSEDAGRPSTAMIARATTSVPYLTKGPRLAVKNLARLLVRSRDTGNAQGTMLNPVLVELFSSACVRMHLEWRAIAESTNLLGFGGVLERVMGALADTLTSDKLSCDDSHYQVSLRQLMGVAP